MRDYLISHYRSCPIVVITSMEFTLEYLPYFALGILTRINQNLINGKLDQTWIIIGLAAIYIIALQFTPNLRFGVKDARFFPFIALFLICLFMIFYRMRFLLNNSNAVGKRLSYIGRNTLPIYLIHYFIIIFFTIGTVQVLHDWKLLDLDSAFPLTVCLALLIIGVCLGVDKLLKALRIRHFFFPKYK